MDLNKLGFKPIYNRYHPVGESELTALEDFKGFALPPDYREFVSKFGWSTFSPNVYVKSIEPPPADFTDEDVIGIEKFYGGDLDGYGLLSVANSTFCESMPPATIPIASSYGGSQFILGLGDKDLNKVYFWSFEGWPDPDDYLDEGLEVPDDWQYRNLTLVAESFTDFLNRLVPNQRDGT